MQEKIKNNNFFEKIEKRAKKEYSKINHAIKNLQVGHEYIFYVTANDELGRRSESVAVKVTIKD